jgi:hypothetical protein
MVASSFCDLFVKEKPVIPKTFAVGVHHTSCHFGFHFVLNAQGVEPGIDPQHDPAFIAVDGGSSSI